ncbi:MAG: tetratricopeptide repeat protein [Thermoguttaceae bacterium]|jgi:tetratricopeptide (TPR) repeat protein
MANRKKSSDKHIPQTWLRSSVPAAARLGAMAGAALIAATICIAYYPALSSGFILDDDKLLTANSQIRDQDGPYQFWLTTKAYDYWPVTNSTLWMEWRLWEMNPIGYHVTNLALHAAASLLIWLILRKLSIPGAFLAALIFAVHPVNVESAAWIAQRKDDLAIVFFLLSILWYLKTDMPTVNVGMAPATPARSQGGPWERETSARPLAPGLRPLAPSLLSFWYWLSLLAFMFGMLSKGSIAILPLLLLGIVWWLRPLTRWDLARTAPFFLIAAVLAAVNVWFQTHMGGSIRTVGLSVRILEAGAVVWFYLYKAVLPINLVFIYPLWRIDPGDFRWWLPLAATLAVTAVLWLFRKGWSRPILFAWGFFCVSLLPVMGFTDVGFMKHSLVADHYQHIAVIGVIALAAAGWSVWSRRLRGAFAWTACAAAVIAVLALLLLSRLQNELYRDTAELYRRTLEKNPDCWLIHNNLGVILANAGCKQEAIAHYKETLRRNPDYAEAHNNLGNVLGALDHWQDALGCYHRALDLVPENPLTLNNLGYALGSLGRFPEAIEQYQNALKIQPNISGIHDNMAFTLLQMNRLPEALEHYQVAIGLEPKDPKLHAHYGFALTKAGRLPEAIDECREALRLAPNYPDAHVNLGTALALSGQQQEAIEHYKRSLLYKPDNAPVYYQLSMSYVWMRRFSEAEAAARRALDLARSQGQTALARQAEDLLNSVHARSPDLNSAPPSLK